jgi:hypothetical protein
MEGALIEWNNAKNRSASGNIELGEEALARQQYYQLKSEVDEALSGRLLQGTLVQNGSSGGTLQLQGGVLTAERRLRLLIGMSPADGQLLRTLDEPTMASIHFDWYACMDEAIRQRPELQRTHISVRKREMELLAAQNFLNPRLDAVGRYRFRGFGDDLLRTQPSDSVPSSAIENMMSGNQQEWFLGVEYTVPIGYRKAHLAVRNAELLLTRERIVQREQQRTVVHDLTNAVTDAVRAYEACQNSLNRFLAAQEVLASYDAQDENELDIDVDHLLDAQRRVVESEIRYYRSRSEYAVALKNVHLEKGSLLEYHNLHIFDRPAAQTTTSVVSDQSEAEKSPDQNVQTVSSASVANPKPSQVEMNGAKETEIRQ